MKYTKKNIFKTTEDQYEFLRRLSFESHKSMSQIIRECLKKEYPDFPFGDQMAFNGIYGYYDKKNQQMMYIGQSNDIERRHRDHITPSRYNEQVVNRVLQNNPERYELVIIKSRPGLSKEDRDILEKHYIEFYNTFADDKFNFTTGGDGGLFSEETRKKISEALKGENNPMYGKQNDYVKGIPFSKQRMRNISKSRSRTGFFRVYPKKNKVYKQGFQWCYHYYEKGEKRQTHITSVDLLKLKQKVIKQGLEWFIVNEDIAKQVCVKFGYDLEEVS